MQTVFKNQFTAAAAAAAAGSNEVITPAGEKISGSEAMMKRDFCFVPYGASFPDDKNNNNRDPPRPTIACDGRISITPRSDLSDNNDDGPPPHLELSHWANHQTPKELYADTSTEIALNFVKLRREQQQLLQRQQLLLLLLQQQEKNSNTDTTAMKTFENYADFDNAWVLNNHFDTDGVLSVWACLQPEEDVLDRYAHLMIQGAEAGDFGEWSSDNGVKLDCTMNSLLKECSNDDDEMAYHAAIEQLPDMLQDFELTGGQSYEHLWRNGGWEQALSGWQDIQDGRVKLERFEDSRLVLVYEEPQQQQQYEEDGAQPPLLSPYALHRGLREAGLWSDTTRILRILQHPMSADNSRKEKQHTWSYSYQYEKIGHGWVQDVIKRHHVPDIDKADLIQKLQEHFCKSDENEPPATLWMEGGSSGLVSICQSGSPTRLQPSQVARALVELDPGAASHTM
jgi:hypothetical protein